MAQLTCTCGAPMSSRRVTVVRTVAGRTLTIRNVPAFVCPRCDDVFYKASTVKGMDALVRENPGGTALQYPGGRGYDAEILDRYAFACLEDRFLRSLGASTR